MKLKIYKCKRLRKLTTTYIYHVIITCWLSGRNYSRSTLDESMDSFILMRYLFICNILLVLWAFHTMFFFLTYSFLPQFLPDPTLLSFFFFPTLLSYPPNSESSRVLDFIKSSLCSLESVAIPWNLVDLLEVTPLKKTDSPSPKNYQLKRGGPWWGGALKTKSKWAICTDMHWLKDIFKCQHFI